MLGDLNSSAADRLTVVSLLKQHGYATACIGKWHLGWNWPTKEGAPASSAANRSNNVDFTKPIAGGLITRGFDHYFGVDVPNYPPYCFIENNRAVPASIFCRPIVRDSIKCSNLRG